MHRFVQSLSHSLTFVSFAVRFSPFLSIYLSPCLCPLQEAREKIFCRHVKVVWAYRNNSITSTESVQYGPLPAHICSEPFTHIIYVSLSESPSSELSFIRPSQGRSKAHMFLVTNNSSRCFVKAYKRHDKDHQDVWCITCETTSGAHTGRHSPCVRSLYKLLEEHGDSSLQVINPCHKLPIVTATYHQPPKILHVWTMPAPSHILTEHWNLGRTYNNLGARFYLCPIHPEDPDSKWQMEVVPKPAVVFGPKSSQYVSVYQLRHTTTNAVLTVGVMEGVFLATPYDNVKTIRYYDPLIFYYAYFNVTSGASICQKYEKLFQRYDARLTTYLERFPLPNQQDFTADFHIFVASQVSSACTAPVKGSPPLTPTH